MKKKYLISGDQQIGMAPENKHDLQNDFYDSLRWIVKKAAEEPECIGMILPGDIRDTKAIEPNQFIINEILSPINTNQKLVGCIQGNHDETTPNWIDMFHEQNPKIINITNPDHVTQLGLDNKTVIAFDYMLPDKLEPMFKEYIQKGYKTFIIHQSLGEFSAAAYSNINVKKIDMIAEEYGKSNITIFAGDIHNYGDVSYKNVRAFSSGSTQATDIDEGYNKLVSEIHETKKKDFRKFILWWDDETNEVIREEISPQVIRPWYYDHMDDASTQLPLLYEKLTKEWEGRKKGRIRIKVPIEQYASIQALAVALDQQMNFPFETVKIQALNKKETNKEQEFLTQTNIIDRKAWMRNTLVKLGKEDPTIDTIGIDLIQKITSCMDSKPATTQLAYKDWKSEINQTNTDENISQ